MKKLSTFLLLLGFHFPGISQFDSTAFRYAQTIDQNDIKTIIYTLASDSMLGRNTASEGQKRAESFLVQQFKEIGIDPGNGNSYIQTFSVKEGGFIDINLKVGNKPVSNEEVFTVSAVKGSEMESDAIIFGGYGIDTENYNDYKNIDVKGKALFILPGEPVYDGKSRVNGLENSDWGKSLELKINTARLVEPRVIFIVLENYNDYKSRYAYWVERKPMKLADQIEEKLIPVVFISLNAFLDIFDLSDKKFNNLIKKINEKGLPKTLEKKKHLVIDFNGDEQSGVSSNILAAIPGTDLKDEWIIISAHYDHLGVSGDDVFNGADDNASGTTAVLEIAKAFKTAENDGIKPRRSILFLLVSGEEKGLLGSDYYSQHPVYSFDKTMVDLNIDMVGRRDDNHEDTNNYIYLIGADKISKELHEISENVNATYKQLELDYTFNAEDDPNRFYYRSDQYNFAKNGIPIIFYFSGIHKDYHKLTDTADKIELDALQNRAQLVFYTAWYLANKDEMLQKD